MGLQGSKENVPPAAQGRGTQQASVWKLVWGQRPGDLQYLLWD